ncbi:MAG: murein biosynthesis integral membrane protein MurJ [Coriobacteriia bacterium]|nr:murein biosynthesis integral membrane protein MurJ [Coriobacteriia bacterium]
MSISEKEHAKQEHEPAVEKDTLDELSFSADGASAENALEADAPPEEKSALEEAQVGKSTLVMVLATTLSRITGFVRAWALALALGPGAIASAYTASNNMSNMIFELIAGGVLFSVFIPTFMRIRKERGDEASWRFAGNLMTLFAVVLGIIALLGTLFPQPIMWTQYFLAGDSGNVEELLELASFFFRFFAIQAVFYGVGMIIQALLNAQRKYLWASLGPVFNNLVVIGFLLAASQMYLNETTFTLIAVGTSLGVLVMFLVMIPSLRKTGFKLYIGIDLRDPELHTMLKLALPMIFYVGCNLVAVSVRNATAATTGDASQSVIFFASVWHNLPYGIIAVSVATALFTELSKAATDKNMAEFKTSLVAGLRTTTLLMLPASALMFGLAGPLISLYVGGRTDAADVPAIVAVLQIWAVSLVFFAGLMYLLRAFYSLSDTWTPAIANFALTIVQVVGYLFLTGNITTYIALGVIGIPISDGIFFVLLFLTLLYLLRRKIGSFDIKSFMGVFAKMTVVALAVGVVAYYGSRLLTESLAQTGLIPDDRLLGLVVVLVIGIIGLALTAIAAKLLGIEEIGNFSKAIKRKFSRSKA